MGDYGYVCWWDWVVFFGEDDGMWVGVGIFGVYDCCHILIIYIK